MFRWMKWDGTGRNRFFLNHLEDQIYFLRQYISGGGYGKSETNQLIFNFKKSPTAPVGQLYYKNCAINRFAIELRALLMMVKKNVALTWIPPSKAKNNPEYDNRLQQVANIACSTIPQVTPIEIFSSINSVNSLHLGGVRHPDIISSNWENCCLPGSLLKLDGILVIDDILTTGASMRAAFNQIHSIFGPIPVAGIVWALAVDDPNPFEGFTD